MEGQVLTRYAGLLRNPADVPRHTFRFLDQAEHILGVIFRAGRQKGQCQIIKRYCHRTTSLVLHYGHRPPVSHRPDVAPPKTLHITQPESSHAGESEGYLHLMLIFRCRLYG